MAATQVINVVTSKLKGARQTPLPLIYHQPMQRPSMPGLDLMTS